jgi:hypothetical protein
MAPAMPAMPATARCSMARIVRAATMADRVLTATVALNMRSIAAMTTATE